MPTDITDIHHLPLCSFVDKHNNTVSHYRWKDKSSKWFPYFVGATRHDSHLDLALSAWRDFWQRVMKRSEKTEIKLGKKAQHNLNFEWRQKQKTHKKKNKLPLSPPPSLDVSALGECEEKCKQIKTQKDSVSLIPTSFSSCLSLLAITPSPPPQGGKRLCCEVRVEAVWPW